MSPLNVQVTCALVSLGLPLSSTMGSSFHPVIWNVALAWVVMALFSSQSCDGGAVGRYVLGGCSAASRAARGRPVASAPATRLAARATLDVEGCGSTRMIAHYMRRCRFNVWGDAGPRSRAARERLPSRRGAC